MFTLGSQSIEWHKETDSSNIVCSGKTGVLWKIRFDPPPALAEEFDGFYVIMGKWDGSNYGIVSVNDKKGSIRWSNYLENFPDLAGFQKIGDSLLLVYSKESEITVFNVKTGRYFFRNQFVNNQEFLQNVTLRVIGQSDRIVIFPANSALYSIPFSTLLNDFNFFTKAPIFNLEYSDIFTANVGVGTIDTNIIQDDDLFNLFANRFMESKYCDLQFADSSLFWDRYSEKLSIAAYKKGYENVVLKHALNSIRPKKKSRGVEVPIGAFQMRFKGRTSWAICCLWGFDLHDLSHFCVSVFDLEKGGKVGYASCM